MFRLRDDLIDSYRQYATSFMRISDERIRSRVDEALDEGKLWPYPQIGLNPAFRAGGTIDELVAGPRARARGRPGGQPVGVQRSADVHDEHRLPLVPHSG